MVIIIIQYLYMYVYIYIRSMLLKWITFVSQVEASQQKQVMGKSPYSSHRQVLLHKQNKKRVTLSMPKRKFSFLTKWIRGCSEHGWVNPFSRSWIAPMTYYYRTLSRPLPSPHKKKETTRQAKSHLYGGKGLSAIE